MLSMVLFMCRDPGDTMSKVNVVSSLLSALKIAILMLLLICPKHSYWKWVWPDNENSVNLKSASFIAIMLLHKGLTHMHSQKKSLSCILARVSL